MGNNNDFTATAGITMEQWQKDVASITSDIAKIQKQSDSLDKGLKTLGTNLKIGAATAAIGSFAHTLVLSGRNAGEMSKALADLDESGYDYAKGTVDSGRQLSGVFADIAGSISNIPILGKVFDFLTAPITATARFSKELRDVNTEMRRQVGTSSELESKLNGLTEREAALRTQSVLGVWKGEEKRENALKALTQARIDTQSQFVRLAQKESQAQSGIIAGSEKNAKLAASDLAYQKEIATIEEGAKNSAGKIDELGLKVIAAGSKEAGKKKDARDLEIQSAEDIAKIEVDAAHETLETRMDGLNGAVEAALISLTAAEKEKDIASKLTVEAKRAADLKFHAAEREFDLANRTRKEAVIAIEQQSEINAAQKEIFTAQVAADRSALDAATKKKKLFKPGTVAFQAAENEEVAARNKLSVDLESLNVAARQSALDTSVLDSKLAGNKLLSDLEANRAAYQERIRKAQFEGNDALAQQLEKQKALNDLDIRAHAYRATPNEKRASRKEQEAQDAAIRHINSMEKNNPNSVASDGRNHLSKAAKLARQEYAQRHGNLPAAHKNVIQMMQVQEIVATVARIATLTPGG